MERKCFFLSAEWDRYVSGMEPDVRQRIDNTGKRYRNKDKVAKNKRSAEGAENAEVRRKVKSSLQM